MSRNNKTLADRLKANNSAYFLKDSITKIDRLLKHKDFMNNQQLLSLKEFLDDMRNKRTCDSLKTPKTQTESLENLPQKKPGVNALLNNSKFANALDKIQTNNKPKKNAFYTHAKMSALLASCITTPSWITLKCVGLLPYPLNVIVPATVIAFFSLGAIVQCINLYQSLKKHYQSRRDQKQSLTDLKGILSPSSKPRAANDNSVPEAVLVGERIDMKNMKGITFQEAALA